MATIRWSDHAHMRLKQRWKVRPKRWVLDRISNQILSRKNAWKLCNGENGTEHWGVLLNYHGDMLWIPIVINIHERFIVTVQPSCAWRDMNYPLDAIDPSHKSNLQSFINGLL